MSSRLSRVRTCHYGPFTGTILRSYSYDEEEFFKADGADLSTQKKRKAGFRKLASSFNRKYVKSREAMGKGLSDLRFTNTNRVPFPFKKIIQDTLKVGSLVVSTNGPEVQDVDGNWAIDLSGSYGVNVAGNEMYKKWMVNGCHKTADLGPVLGPLHPVVIVNVKLLQEITGLDEVSFHMSGTEAVMCAIRLARFNRKRRKIVQFNGAYHGWWDGVQPGPGNERSVPDVITLKDMNPLSLATIRARGAELAAVIVNPFQAFHPNSPPPSDLVLMSNKARKTDAGISALNHPYAVWLRKLREACDENDVPLIFDEVYSGFRLSRGGGAAYFGVKPDMIVYGKTLGGGMPVGVVCGKEKLMRRFDPLHPLRVAYVIGTFSAHPSVMGSMNEFLQWVTTPESQKIYEDGQRSFDEFAASTNEALALAGMPLKITNLATVFTFEFTCPSRYHWMFQYYLRDQGVNLAWVGTGRCIVSLDFTKEHYKKLQDRIMAAAKRMAADGFWSAEIVSSNARQAARMAKELAFHSAIMPFKSFYDKVMEQKEIDHHASHSHLINQFLHFISSSIFIWCYVEVMVSKTGDWSWPVELGLISLLVRQAGHYVFEPPCHDAEQAMLGFDTRAKVKICLLYGVYFLPSLVAGWRASRATRRPSALPMSGFSLRSLLFLDVSRCYGGATLLRSQCTGGSSSTDPFTDLPAYWRSCYQVFSPRLLKDAFAKSFPKWFLTMFQFPLKILATVGASTTLNH